MVKIDKLTVEDWEKGRKNKLNLISVEMLIEKLQ